MRFFEMLKGKIIINTRPEGSEDLIGNALKELGANVLVMPLIEILPVQIPKEVISDILKSKSQWLVFTSKNGVDHLLNQLELNQKTKCLPFKTAVFGERTAMALKEKGIIPDLINLQNTSDDLLKELYPKIQYGEKVLLVLGDLATNLMEEKLKTKAQVERLNVYHTVSVQSIDPEILKLIQRNKYDLMLFTSPSGFNSFWHLTGNMINPASLKIACLGPTTEEAILAKGIKPLVVANPSGKAGLIKGVENFFAVSDRKEYSGESAKYIN
jgi:uroporphyrinogen-III synthase